MNTLHVISHTHWDREWYRTFQQFRLRLIHLVDGVLDTLSSNPQFRYFMLDGQTIVLDDYLQIRPEREGDLRHFIQTGRLTIGPWHILPDEFLVSPESTIRNLLQGEATARRFGPKMRIGYIPDPFGHIGQMPQILKGFGIHSACVQRGLSDQPCEFHWQAPDGSQVFMAYMRDGYGNAAGLPCSNQEQFNSEVKRLRDNLLPHSAGTHFLFMLGTDHMEPPVETTQAIESARGQLDGDILVHSSLADYITAIQASVDLARLPVIAGELRACKRSHLLPGVMSTRMWIKQRNRACETLLEKWAEPTSTFASHASLADQPGRLAAPKDVINQAWRLLMENHPHDSICGCSIDQVHDEMKVRFDQVDQISEEITRQSLEGLAAAIDTGSLPAVIVFNPTSNSRVDLVEASVESILPFDLLDGSGTPIPYEKIGLGSQELIHVDLKPKELQALSAGVPDGKVMGMKIVALDVVRSGTEVKVDAVVTEQGEADARVWAQGVETLSALIADAQVEVFHVTARSADKTRIRFAASLPGLGWQGLRLQPRLPAQSAPARISAGMRLLLPLAKIPAVQHLLDRKKTVRPPSRIENDLLTVTAEKDGTLTVFDRVHGSTFIGLNRFISGGDCGDEYNFCPPATDRQLAPRLKSVRIERSSVTQTLHLVLDLSIPDRLAPDRKSRSHHRVTNPIRIKATLTQGVPRVDIHAEVDNRAQDHRLRVHFPSSIQVEKAQHDGHFDINDRPLGIPAFDASWVEEPRPEVPQRAFTSVSNGKIGLTVANRGLPECEVLKDHDGNAEIAVTLLRCVSWLSRDDFSNRRGHAGPALETPGAQMLGKWSFDYAIIPSGERQLDAWWQAYSFETPMRSITTGAHAGLLPTSGSFAEVSPAEFTVSAVKQAEDGKGWVLRGYNLGAEAIEVKIRPWRCFPNAEKCSLSEEHVHGLKPDQDGGISLPARGHEIVTVRFWE